MSNQASSDTSIEIIVVPGEEPKLSKRFPWPRHAEDDPSVQVGVDVVTKRKDVIKITHKFFRVADISMEELIQEVFLAIIHKNHTRSAHDPRKSSFGHYVYMIANNVCINLVHKKKRYDKEKDSIDAPSFDEEGRSLIETYEEETTTKEEEKVNLDKLERFLRINGHWDIARYVHAVKSGAQSDVIKEALSFGRKSETSKSLKSYRVKLGGFYKDGYLF